MVANTNNGVFTYNGKDFPFEFKTSLAAKEKIRFTKAVVESIVVNNFYYYVIKDMFFDFKIAEYFSEINLYEVLGLDDEDAPVDIAIVEEFIENSNIVDIIVANAEPGVIEELKKSVDLNVAYITGIQINPIADSISNLFNTIEKKISTVNTEELMGAVRNISDVRDEFTMDKLIEAYGKSDLFKQTALNGRDFGAKPANADKPVAKVKKTAAAKDKKSNAPEFTVVGKE